MQVLTEIERRLVAMHKAERTFANVYAHARGAGKTRRDAIDNAEQSTRSRVLSYERRRELVEIVEGELRGAGVPVQ